VTTSLEIWQNRDSSNATPEANAMIQLLLLSLQCVLIVTWRRVRGRKRHPDWSWSQEIGVTLSLYNGRRAIGLPAADARTESEAFARFLSPPKEVDRRPADLDGLAGEWFEPPNIECNAVILYFHGGGYGIGSTALWAEVLARLALATQSRVLSVDYRLAPEQPYPAAVDDARKAYTWLLESGIAASDIVLAGDSAGGGLVLAALVALRDASVTLPASAILFSPWVDLTSSSKSVETNAAYDWGDRDYLLHWARLYAGEYDLDHPMISPLFAELHALPPLQLHVGDSEMLLDEVSELARRIELSGGKAELKVWPATVHGWLSMAAIFPKSTEASLTEASRFTHQTTAGRNDPAASPSGS
jgi:monoterpene epsilon-lactone hydrolase